MDERSTDDPPLQFGIRDLLIAQALVAACLGLLVMVGIFAVLIIFIATLVLCAFYVRPEDAKLKRAIVDLLGGIVLPTLCIAYDFFLFQRPGSPWDFSCFDLLHNHQALAYLALGWQMFTLLIWLIGCSRFGRWSALFAGSFLLGVALCVLIGVPLIPIGLLGMLVVGLGLLAFTPILTFFVFTRNMRQAWRQAKVQSNTAGRQWVTQLLFLLGMSLAVAIPALIYAIAGPWIEIAIKAAPWPRDGR